jgi:hypothetical protein
MASTSVNRPTPIDGDVTTAGPGCPATATTASEPVMVRASAGEAVLTTPAGCVGPETAVDDPVPTSTPDRDH